MSNDNETKEERREERRARREERREERREKRRERLAQFAAWAEEAVRYADAQGLAHGWDGEEKVRVAVAHLLGLIDQATPFPQPAELISDLVLRGVLRPLLEALVEEAFKRLRERGEV